MDTREAIKNRIIELCNSSGIALYTLAIKSGVHPSTVKNIINDSSKNPGTETIKKLCDGLGITIVDFFDTEVFRNLEQEIK